METDKNAKAPYITKGWMHAFLDKIKKIRMEKIDANIIKSYDIAPGANASKVVTALKFFNIIDDDGNVIGDNFDKLRLEGDKYKEAVKEMVTRAYSNLIQEIDIEKASVPDLVNYFRFKYKYTDFPAKQASKLFTYLCKEAGIKLSPELEELNKVEHYKKVNKSPKLVDRKTYTSKKAKDSKKAIITGTYPTISISGSGINLDFEIKNDADIENFKTILDNLKTKLIPEKQDS